jgi:hypothetical protein
VDGETSNETRGTPLHNEGSKGKTTLRKVKEDKGEVKVQLHSFLSLALEMSDQPNTPAVLPSGNVPLVLTEQETAWDAETGLALLGKSNTSDRAGNRTRYRPARSIIIIPIALPRLLVQLWVRHLLHSTLSCAR